MRHRTVRGTRIKEEISWGSPVTKLETFRCQKPPRNRKRRMDCTPWHTGCASLEQAITNESQLQVTSDREPQHPRQSVCCISQAWWSEAWCSCAPRSADQPYSDQRAAHPMSCHPVCQEELLSGPGAWDWQGTPGQGAGTIRKMHITSCWLRTTPKACLKTKEWGKI